MTHDETLDWVECTGWRCPTSGKIVTKESPPSVPARGEEPPAGSEVDALKAGIKDAIDTLTMPMPVYSGNVKVDDWTHRRDLVKDDLKALLAGTPQGEA